MKRDLVLDEIFSRDLLVLFRTSVVLFRTPYDFLDCVVLSVRDLLNPLSLDRSSVWNSPIFVVDEGLVPPFSLYR